jgi:hypothetical protein
MRRFCFSILSLSLGVGLMLAPGYSTTLTTYSSLTNWQTATAAGYQTLTFAGYTQPNTATDYWSPTGVTDSGVEFIGYNSPGASDIQVIDTSGEFTWYNWGTGQALIQPLNRPNSSSPLPYINIVLPANVSALGMYLYSANNQAMSYTITVAGNQYTVPTYTQPTLAFWGVTSATPISSVQLTLAGTTYNQSAEALVADFVFGDSDMSAAPEAGTYLLIGSGLIGFVALRKRLAPRK